jgi:hypothetical protein
MAARVQVVVEARDQASGVLRGITGQFGALGGAVEELTAKNINWGNVAQMASQLVINGMRASIDATTKYAAEVRDLALAAGTGAEEASRMLQVLDDYEITAQDVTAATRFMTQQGFAPTVETIAQLSDQYNNLNSAQEKNAFILRNFGRGGMQWVNMLSQGGDRIRELNAGVDEALILNEKQVQASEKYRLALDAWNDSVLALKVSVGNALLPALTDVLQVTTNLTEASIELQASEEYATMSLAQRAAAAINGAHAMGEEASAAKAATQSVTDLGRAEAESSKGLEKRLSMMERLNQATQDQINKEGYRLLQEKFAEGGITDEEAAILERAGVALGIFDERAVATTKSITKLTDAVVEGTISIQEYAAALNAIPSEITTQIMTTGGTATGGHIGGAGQQSGGTVYAGGAYTVGEAGSEPFFPAQNGRILGHAEALHAMSLGGGGGIGPFYGNVTLQISEDGASGLLEVR